MIQFDEHIFQMGWNHHLENMKKHPFQRWTYNFCIVKKHPPWSAPFDNDLVTWVLYIYILYTIIICNVISYIYTIIYIYIILL